jgi:hypothetical protein
MQDIEQQAVADQPHDEVGGNAADPVPRRVQDGHEGEDR